MGVKGALRKEIWGWLTRKRTWGDTSPCSTCNLGRGAFPQWLAWTMVAIGSVLIVISAAMFFKTPSRDKKEAAGTIELADIGLKKGQKIKMPQVPVVGAIINLANLEPLRVTKTYPDGEKEKVWEYGQDCFLVHGCVITIVGISNDTVNTGQVLLRCEIDDNLCKSTADAAPNGALFFLEQKRLLELIELSKKEIGGTK